VKDDLTPKQRQYLAALACGKSTLEVAQDFVVSHHTVRNTITKAKERVGATSTANLIALSVDKGWIHRNGSESAPFYFVP
jgi:DNA-binding CsgD family transcriptional regulator